MGKFEVLTENDDHFSFAGGRGILPFWGNPAKRMKYLVYCPVFLRMHNKRFKMVCDFRILLNSFQIKTFLLPVNLE